MAERASLTKELVRRLFKYDASTGELTWNERTKEGWPGRESRMRSWNTRYAGRRAGKVNSKLGYRYVGVLGKLRLEHRLIWLWVHGYMPEQIDHINHIRNDNRLENLRDVTCAINAQNITMPSNNTSGHVGVYWHKPAGKWMAQIMIGKRAKYLGLFGDIDAAIAARNDANEEIGFHANHGLPANDNNKRVETA